MRLAIAAGLALLLLGFIVSFATGEEPMGAYTFDTQEEVKIRISEYGKKDFQMFTCPMLPGKRVTIPEGKSWEVEFYGRSLGQIHRLREHLVARKVNSILIHSRLSDLDAQAIAAMPWLEDLSFENVLVQSDWVQVLEGHSGLKELHFQYCQFEDGFVNALNSMKSQTKIEITDCVLEDAQWKLLTGNVHIVGVTNLNVQRNWIGLYVLPTLPNIEEVFLAGEIEQDAILRLKPLQKIKDLLLLSPLPSSCWADLLEGKPAMESVWAMCADSPEILLKACAKLPHLDSLSFERTFFDEASVAAFKSLPSLRRLTLSGCRNVTSEMIEAQARIESLDVHVEDLRQLGVGRARSMTSLKDVVIAGPRPFHEDGTAKFDKAAAEVVCAMPALRSLRLHSDLSYDGAEALSNAPETLKVLDIWSDVDDRHMEHLSKISSLEDLSVYGAQKGLTPKGLAEISKLSNLRSLSVDAYPTSPIDKSFIDVLLGLPSLAYASLSYAALLTLKDVRRLAALPNLTSFEPGCSKLKALHEAAAKRIVKELARSVHPRQEADKWFFQSSRKYTPKQWEPINSDVYCGYRIEYLTNSEDPEADDATQCGFLAVPLTLDDGGLAFLCNSSPGRSTYVTTELTAGELAALLTAGERDVLWSAGITPGLPMYVKRVPFYSD